MCGIAGFLLDKIDPAAPNWLTAMTQAMFHRGPDDGGGVVFGLGGKPTVTRRFPGPRDAPDWSHIPAQLALGARRLAIVDRSECGAQPMTDPDQRVWLVYNGEIYNHRDLRARLIAHGMTFRGHSDTEVLLNGYRAWGPDVFSRLDGMFACAIVDWTAGKLLLARDFFGIKPLYICRFSAGMAFASEIGALRTLPGRPAAINEAVLRDFLCDGRIDTGEDTIFEDIWSLPGGAILEMTLRPSAALQSRGRLQEATCPPPPCAAEPSAELGELLRGAVADHLQGDVPIGSCLSGGIDSATIVCLAHERRQTGANPNLSQHTFTAILPGDPLDEAAYARAVVDACDGLESHLVEPTPQRFLDCLTSLVRHQEQPFASPSIYMQWEVMRAARERGITVLLDGQGGDELFCGYEGYIPMYLADLLGRAKPLRFVREYRGARANHYAGRPLMPHVAASLLPMATRDRLRVRRWTRTRPWLDPDIFTPAAAPAAEARLNIRREAVAPCGRL